MKEEKIKSKERFCYIFSICGLVLLLAIFAFLYFSGIIFSATARPISSIPLGSNIVVDVEDSKASAISFSLNGAIVPGEKLPQNINISNKGQTDLYLRAKAYTFTQNEGLVDMNLLTTNNWVFLDDGYYYFMAELPVNATVGLSSKIVVSNDFKFSDMKIYNVNILVETLSTEFDANQIWGVDMTELAS